jgi:hypothetical protein
VAWSARGAGGRSESEGGANGERRGLRPAPGPGAVAPLGRDRGWWWILVGSACFCCGARLRRTAPAPGRRAAWRGPLGARVVARSRRGGERRTARASAAPARGPWRRPDETGVGGGFSSGRPASAAAHGYGELQRRQGDALRGVVRSGRGWSLGVGGGFERRTARASAAPARGPWRRSDETGVGGGFSSGRPASAAAHGYGELQRRQGDALRGVVRSGRGWSLGVGGGANGERRGLRPRRPGGRGAARTRPGLVVDSRRVGLLLLRRTATANCNGELQRRQGDARACGTLGAAVVARSRRVVRTATANGTGATGAALPGSTPRRGSSPPAPRARRAR